MRVLVPLAEGFEEIESLTIIDVLRRAGIEVDVVGIPSSIVKGSRGVRVIADKKLNEIDPDEYDGIILPGGNPGYINLGKSSKLLEILKRMNAQGRLIGAICAAPLVLVKAGILKNRKATVYPGLEKEIPHPRDEDVVVDENIITSKGPGTSMKFALKIVEILLGKSKSESLKKKLLVR